MIAENVVYDEITDLLQRWSAGEAAVLERLFPLVYHKLREVAGHLMRGERTAHTLQPTALVHEMFLAVAAGEGVDCRDSSHFYKAAARVMRHILVDHARSHRAARRGGGVPPLPLEEDQVPANQSGIDPLLLDACLERLAQLDPRKAQVIELRFFAGLSVAKVAEVLGVSQPTVILDTRMARAWLYREIRGEDGRGSLA